MQHKRFTGFASSRMFSKEVQVNSYNELVRRARVERSAYIGELISSAIANSWFGLKRMTTSIAAGSVTHRDGTADHLSALR
jgi:hypothetical protein